MGKTVTTYLVDGDPQGTRYVFIENNVCRMYVIPRTKLDILKEEKCLQTSALYILLGESDDAKPEAYIGQTDNFKERVKFHDNKKDFWNKVLLFISTSGSGLTKDFIQYLEHCAIRDAKEVNSYVLTDNKQIPKEQPLPEHQKAPMEDFYQDVKFLTAFYGCNIFTVTKKSEKLLFYARNHGCESFGYYDTEGFTVMKGSIVCQTATPSFVWKEKREKMIKEYTSKEGNYLVLTSDISFSSPSTAAGFCLGRSENGWRAWKNKDGQTLDSVIRKALCD